MDFFFFFKAMMVCFDFERNSVSQIFCVGIGNERLRCALVIFLKNFWVDEDKFHTLVLISCIDEEKA